MYPGRDVLEELGRVTICGARLDLQTAFLLHHLDPEGEPLERVRPLGGSALTRAARARAEEHLDEPLLGRVLEALDVADEARKLRNEAVHQEWVLRGPDGMRTVADLPDFADKAELDAYIQEWERQATPSPGWLRLPARGVDLEEPQTLEQLQHVEQRLGAATVKLVALTFTVASARDAGSPSGWRP